MSVTWLLPGLALVGLSIVVMLRFARLQDVGLREKTLFALRLAVCVFASLAFMQIIVPLPGSSVHVVFLLDVSDSVPQDAVEKNKAYIAGQLGQLQPGDTASVVAFAADTEVLLERVRGPQPFPEGTSVQKTETDFAKALGAAVALLPQGGQARIVVLSDGRNTMPLPQAALAAVRASGAQVYTAISDGRSDQAEASVRDIIAPLEVEAGRVHDIAVLVESTTTQRARLVLLKDGTYLGEERVILQEGMNRFSYPVRFEEPGVHQYQAQLEPEADWRMENNEFRRMVRVTGPSQVLWVHGALPSSGFIRAAEVQGISVRRSRTVPTSLEELAAFDAVVLDDVPAWEIPLAAQENLERYVRVLGGGLLMTGRQGAFGPGGYYRSPLEKALPVDVDSTSSMSMPSLAIIFLLDKSGSMGGGPDDEEKLRIVMHAIAASVRVMNPFHIVGVLAFDAKAEWIVPMLEASDESKILEAMTTLRSGGGTDLYAALKEVQKSLPGIQAANKHLVILSDGISEPGDIEGAARAIAQEGVTISTVTAGADANIELMRKLAIIGKGRFYRTPDIRNIPVIFTSETTILSKDLIVPGPFVPETDQDFEPLASLGRGTGFPPLDGHVRTYLKPQAMLALLAPGQNPLLAWWNYGSGRSVALTTRLDAAWGRSWLGWGDFPRFAGQLFRWLARPAGQGSLTASLAENPDGMLFTLDVQDTRRSFVDFLEMTAAVVDPAGKELTVPLLQTRPGQYKALLPAVSLGNYLATVSHPGAAPMVFGYARSYSREYASEDSDFRTWRQLTADTGGTFMTEETRAELFSRSQERPSEPVESRPALIVFLLLLFLVDMVLRALVPKIGA